MTTALLPPPPPHTAGDQVASTPVVLHSISENLKAMNDWMSQTQTPPQRQGVLSLVKTSIFVTSPVVIIAVLGYILSMAANSGKEPYCVCPDGGVRSTVSKHRLVGKS